MDIKREALIVGMLTQILINQLDQGLSTKELAMAAKSMIQKGERRLNQIIDELGASHA